MTLTLQELPESPYQKVLYAGGAPLVYSALGGDLPDPSYTLPLFYGPGGGANFTKYNNPQLNALFAQANRLSSFSAKTDLLKTAAAKLLIEDLPWIWIAQPGWQMASRSNVTGLNWYLVTRWQPIAFT